MAINNQFGQDVLKGLLHDKKYILSKYFYDEKGSELFNKITRHPDYYLTQCELEILTDNKFELSDLLKKESFNLIELGPGEGIKSLILLEQLIKDSRDFTSYTIDISRNYLNQIVKKFRLALPQLKLKAISKDFFEGLKWLHLHSSRKNVVLFLGSSIGNFDEANTHFFLNKIWEDLNSGDYFLIGFDLRKDIQTLIKAYDDGDGITKQFNLNLLDRINRELEADFQIDLFKHFATYNTYSGAMESYLISTKKQNVFIKQLNHTFHFHEYESIHVEYSYKYLFSQIEQFAAKSGFKIIKNFTDSKSYFTLSMWEVQK